MTTKNISVRERSLALVELRPAELKPARRNARKHTGKQVKKVREKHRAVWHRSHSHPLQIAAVHPAPGFGRIGITFCPGKKFRTSVLTAANLGGDADTTEAIAGQLAGALYGASAA